MGSKCASLKQSMKKCIVNHFKLFNKNFEDNNNSMKLPEKGILKLKSIRDKHTFTFLPKKWQKTLSNDMKD